MIALLWMIGLAMAVDANDQITMQLSGGETVRGWFVRAEAKHVHVHVPENGESARIPLALLNAVEINGEAISLEQFAKDVALAHAAWLQWRANPPPHPAAGVVVVSSLVLAGSGHALLADWEFAPGMLLADAAGMGVVAWEMTHQERLNVVAGGLAISLIMKAYAVGNGVRKARARRLKYGIVQGR